MHLMGRLARIRLIFFLVNCPAMTLLVWRFSTPLKHLLTCLIFFSVRRLAQASPV